MPDRPVTVDGDSAYVQTTLKCEHCKEIHPVVFTRQKDVGSKWWHPYVGRCEHTNKEIRMKLEIHWPETDK